MIWWGEATEAAYSDSQITPSEIICSLSQVFAFYVFLDLFFLVQKHSHSCTPPECLWTSIRAASAPGLKSISSSLMEIMVAHTAVYHEAVCHTVSCPRCSRYMLFPYSLWPGIPPGPIHACPGGCFWEASGAFFPHISSFYHGFLEVLPAKSLVPPYVLILEDCPCFSAL